MKKFNLTIVTTFNKEVEVEADSLEEAIELASNDVDLLDDATDTLDFETEVVPTKKPDDSAKLDRFKKMDLISGVTSDKIQATLDEIRALHPRMQELAETLVYASKKGLKVEQYMKRGGREPFPTYYVSNFLHYFKNSDYKGLGTFDDEYYMVDCHGDVFTSTYSSTFKDGKEFPSDTFKIGPCRSESVSEEFRVMRLRRLKNIVTVFSKIEKQIYDDIDAQINSKL